MFWCSPGRKYIHLSFLFVFALRFHKKLQWLPIHIKIFQWCPKAVWPLEFFSGSIKRMVIRSPLISVLQCMLLVFEQFKVQIQHRNIGNNCFCLTLQVSSYLVQRVFNTTVNTDQIHYELNSSIWSVTVTIKTVLWAWIWTSILLSSHIISVGFLMGMSKSCNWNSSFTKQTRTSSLLSLWCVELCAQLPSRAPLRMLSLSEAQGLSVQRQAKFIKITYKTTVW